MKRALPAKILAANAALITNNDLAAVGEFFAPDYVVHLTDERVEFGHEGVRRFLRMYRRAFPDLQVEVEILVTAKDRVAWQRTCRATHLGAFKGFPPTGRPLIWRDMVTSCFRDGLFVEDWVLSDLAERMLLARKKVRANKG